MSWGEIRTLFLAAIAASQVFGAVAVFSNPNAVLWPMPTQHASQFLGSLTQVLVYLPGLVGAVLIWVGLVSVKKPAGLWLSLIHQLMLVPLFWMPGRYWVMADAFQFAVVVVLNEISNTSHITMLWNLGSNSLLQIVNPGFGVRFYGANVFALICSLYLYRLLRSKALASGESTT
jgi:hypothetical protein